MNPLNDPSPVIRVLLIDDDPDVAEVIREALRTRTDICFEVHAHTDADAGLAALRTGRYDVMLVDYRLGAKSGLDLLQHAMREGCTAPIILLTGNGSSDLERRALALGAADYLVKETLDPDSLQRAIRHSLERAATLLRLRESERQFRGIFEGLFVGMAVADSGGRWVDANPAACALFGVTREELVNTTVTALLDDAAATPLGPGWRRATVEKSAGGDLRLLEYEVSGDLLPDRRIFILRDVTDQRRLEQMQARLTASDRLASLGTLAAGVAHEINNPLGFLMANLDFAIGALRASPCADGHAEVIRALEEAREGGDRMRRTTGDIKTFARGHAEARGPVDVGRVLDSSIRLVGNELRHRATLVQDYAKVPPVDANESRLGQVFLNLLVNAAQAIPEGKAAENEIRVAFREANGRVVVEIRDTGCGIPKEMLPRVFEPFFTTKAVGVGTGLGLSVSHGIVASLGGQITVESEPGRGSVFRVALPVAQAVREEAPRTPEPEKPGRRGRLLVVDDEPFMLRAILRCLGREHDCVSTDSAAEALRRMTAGEHFDLVLSDVMMPDMSGAELYEHVRRISPALAARMVFLSGGAFTQEARTFLESIPNRRIDKPFAAAALRATVRELIELAG